MDLRPSPGKHIGDVCLSNEIEPRRWPGPAFAAEARRDGDSFVITGRTKFVTGADGAGFYIVMARTSGSPDGSGCATCATMDRSMLGGHCEVELDAVRGPEESSLAKVFGAEALHRFADRSVQMRGGAGVSSDLPVARIAREIRPFRIYDGPSEVRRMSLAHRAVRRFSTGGDAS